jgi:hypothetical protein
MPSFRSLLRTFTAVTLVIGSSFTALAQQQQRGPSTAEERDRAVKIASALQADPLSPDKSDRQWFMLWLIQVPDISVPMCPSLHGDLGDEKKSDYPGAIVAAEMGAEAAFVIGHPDRAKDKPAVYAAGVEGAVNAYQAIRTKDAQYRVKELDNATQKRDQGNLANYVSSKKCK